MVVITGATVIGAMCGMYIVFFINKGMHDTHYFPRWRFRDLVQLATPARGRHHR